MFNCDLIIPYPQLSISLLTVVILQAVRMLRIKFIRMYVSINEDMVMLALAMHFTALFINSRVNV